ncbi:hypothetical protein ACFTZK_01570 [Streptomyces decoyicus]|uniref:hypothetical protein n=1 Tax=Streptomyces decoyicus TaxID=249567 RepID=UPI0036333763
MERYLEHQARNLVARYDANSYLCLSAAMDGYDAFARPHAIEPGTAPSVLWGAARPGAPDHHGHSAGMSTLLTGNQEA